MSTLLCFICKFPRSSYWRCSMKKGALKNFGKFTGKHQCRSLFFKKVTGLMPATYFKKRLRDRYSVNFPNFFRTTLSQSTSRWLFLDSNWLLNITLREMCPNTEFFWSVFSHIRTEYREILRIFKFAQIIMLNTYGCKIYLASILPL